MNKLRSGNKKIKWLFGKAIEIPKWWEVQKLEQLTDIVDSKRVPIKESERGGKHGKYPYYGTSGIVDHIDDFIFNEKLLCLAEDGENLRSRVLPIAFTIEGKTWVNNHVHVLRVKETIDHYFLKSFLNNTSLLKYVASTAQPKLNQKDMRSIQIICPKLEEQTKIASIFSGVDALIELTQEVIEKTERLKKGLMQKLLTKGIEHTKFKKTNGLFRKEIKIPEEWSSCQLKDISMLSAGGTPSTFAKEFWNNGTIPWVSSSEVKNNRIIDSDKKITKLGLENSAAKLFPKGTVLVAITGFGMTRGRSAVLEINASTNQSVVGIQPKREILDGEFLWYLLQNQYWVIRNFAQGSQQPRLSLGILEKFQICVPNNISEQQKIASILSGVDAYIQKNQEYKKKMELLKKGLMQKLLTGQIRVKVDH